jgi:hypothetical protein
VYEDFQRQRGASNLITGKVLFIPLERDSLPTGGHAILIGPSRRWDFVR